MNLAQLGLFNEEVLRKPDPVLLESLRVASKSCKRCSLSSQCRQPVFGEGNPNRPPVAFVGEAPGANEDLQGRPFVGPAGELLNKMIEAMGLTREGIYIFNVLLCRPPGNRPPYPEEILMCREWFVGQARAVQPRIIVALGATAANVLLENRKEEPVGVMRKGWHDWQGIPVRVTYHPSFLLRTPEEKNEAWGDLQEVMKLTRR
jgi:uracil-DNA glycosylase family 4